MRTRFIFLILPEVHLLDLAGPDQTIYEAISFGAPFEMHYCGIGSPVTSSAGLAIMRQKHFSEMAVREGDFIVIPGGNVKTFLTAEFMKNKLLFSWLNDCHQKGVNIVSICAGAFVIGQAGLLNGINCTTHFKITQRLQAQFPQAQVKENILFAIENRIYTSAGIASGIDLMLHIVEELTDGYFAHKVARELVVYNRREGTSEQQSVFFQCRNHIHSGIHKVQDFIVENIHVKTPLNELALLACMSERNFTRIFKKETGRTVNEYITAIRQEKIRRLKESPDLSAAQIAGKVGLRSEKQVGRLLRK